jgi:hypothetical protein
MSSTHVHTPASILAERAARRAAGLIAHNPSANTDILWWTHCSCYECRDHFDPTGEVDAAARNQDPTLNSAAELREPPSWAAAEARANLFRFAEIPTLTQTRVASPVEPSSPPAAESNPTQRPFLPYRTNGGGISLEDAIPSPTSAAYALLSMRDIGGGITPPRTPSILNSSDPMIEDIRDTVKLYINALSSTEPVDRVKIAALNAALDAIWGL